MDSTRVVHVNDHLEGAIYIGRATRKTPVGSSLGNPFKIGRDGDRLAVIEQYKHWLARNLPVYPILIDALIACRGRPLACWCRKDGQIPTEGNRCHGDILCEFLDHYSDEELRAMAKESPR